MKITKHTLSLDAIVPNPNNPRTITEEKFHDLVKSIKEAPWMLPIRTLVVDEDNVVLGGNMRLAALKEAGIDKVEVQRVTGLTEEQKREFIVKDNVPFGAWDWDILANEWDSGLLNDWGLDVWHDASLDGVFDNLQESTYEPPEPKEKKGLFLDYNDEELAEVKEWIAAVGGSNESAIYEALKALANA